MGTNLQRELRNVITRMDPTGAAIVTDTNVRPWAVKVAKAIKGAGVNGRRSKNAIGSFWQPSAVISDLAAIETLPAPGYRDAFAEVVKYAVAMDRGLFELLERNAPRLLERDLSMLERVLFRCVAAKALIVAKDERDRGPRAILNYGHTAGHALEAATGFRVTHGRAVAFGMRV